VRGGRGGEGVRKGRTPADAFTSQMFVRRNLPQSIPNVWALEVHPARLFAYELRRPGRFFRVEFDLARPIAAPPPPWGAGGGGG
jgi:hypothetical protein